MDIEYIVIQAGGKGTRLEYLTKNKPKALVSIKNLPMIFHLFDKFKDKKFIVIGDYKKDVFKEYLRCFADVEYLFIEADGNKTCGGLRQAIEFIPNNKSFMYIWSDLILSDSFVVPKTENNYIGISGDFECRWSYKSNEFVEEKSFENGVAGLFIFKNKNEIADVPKSGEFVAYLKNKNFNFKRILLSGTKEYGLLSEYQKLEVEKCRPFNSMEVDGDFLIKRGITAQGVQLAKREVAWYKEAVKLEYKRIPEIYEYEPLKMKMISGKNLYEYRNLEYDKKKKILTSLVSNLSELHSLGSIEKDVFSIHEAYVSKTFNRISKVRDLIPFSNEKYININGKQCPNAFFFKEIIERQIMSYKYNDFKFIHGDCTFSNMMIDDNGENVLIDPRGYFGHTELYGDEDYDWAKLYYSLKGNYDRFNLKDFVLTIEQNGVSVNISSNGWEDIADELFDMVPELCEEKIKLLHAIIWISLTTYAWQDYDSICGAFYIGCYYLGEVLK